MEGVMEGLTRVSNLLEPPRFYDHAENGTDSDVRHGKWLWLVVVPKDLRGEGGERKPDYACTVRPTWVEW